MSSKISCHSRKDPGSRGALHDLHAPSAKTLQKQGSVLFMFGKCPFHFMKSSLEELCLQVCGAFCDRLPYLLLSMDDPCVIDFLTNERRSEKNNNEKFDLVKDYSFIKLHRKLNYRIPEYTEIRVRVQYITEKYRNDDLCDEDVSMRCFLQ